MSNASAQEWLERNGFGVEPEPAWIADGRKPDFFCRGPIELWAEAKILEPANYLEDLGAALADLKQRGERLPGLGWSHAVVGEQYDPRAGRFAIHFATLYVPDVIPENERYVVAIPRDPDYSRTFRVRYESDDEISVNHFCVISQGRRNVLYPSLEPTNWGSVSTVEFSDGSSERQELFKVFDPMCEPALAIAFGPSDKPRAISGVGSGAVRRNRSVDRLRGVIADANHQIKNGCRFRVAPSLVMVYHDSLDAAGKDGLLSAAFGDLTVPIDIKSAVLGDPVLVGNGVLSPTKNRSVSAIAYWHRQEEPVTVINPWAHNPVDPGQLPGKKHVVSVTGKIELV